MAKLDTSSIAGYAEMTPEQKVAALESLTVPDAVDLSQYVPKATFDKKASESADYSRQLKALKDVSRPKKQSLRSRRPTSHSVPTVRSSVASSAPLV